MSAIPDASVLELYPDEQNRLMLIVAAVSRKFTGKMSTLENLVALSNEIEDRCREELSLEVICDPTNYDLDSSGQPFIAPVVAPIQRLVPEVFDFARAKYEIQHGFDDGVVGAIREDGSWKEPVVPVAMPGAVDVAGN